MHKSKVRVRFAPSPTGPLHIGGVRTALYNYLFAKQNQGEFILRIEDTDQTRFVEGAEEYIVKAFEWLGIRFDEGVHTGGPFAPYRQSERNGLYEAYALELIEKGWAYFAFDTPEELDSIRKEFEGEKKIFQYDASTRVRMKNSLTLKKSEIEQFRAEGKPYVIRFMFPEHTEIKFKDLIRGEVQFQSQLLDDKVLFKSDGMPTYHLANVVDDHLMEITHVIRGEEWLPSAPLHIMLYKAFDWEETRPQFAHLPLLLKPDGNGKLSKRDGDRLGFPVFPLEWKDPINGEISSGYREQGYFPEAVINILAFLGWNPGSEQEIFSLEELISIFSLERISKSGAKFDLEKAKWFNHQYLLKMSAQDTADLFMLILKKKGIEPPIEFVRKVCELSKNRVNFIHELWNETSFFFLSPNEYDPQVIKKRWKEDTATHLDQICSILIDTSPFSKSYLHDAVSQYISRHQLNMGQIMNCLRLAIVGEAKGPDLFEIIELLACKESTQRIQKAICCIHPNTII